MKIIFFDAKKYDLESFKAENKGKHKIKFVSDRLTSDNVHKSKGFDGVCTFVNCDGSYEVMKYLSKFGVKFWFQRSAGVDNIDLDAAKKFNMTVFNVSAYSPEAIAEFAMTLLLALNRNLHLAYNRIKMNNFSLEGLQGETLHSKTVGILGIGKIGQSFAKIAKGFGLKLLVYDDFAKKNFPNLAKKLKFTYVSKNTIFKESDFISLHLPLTRKTKYLINEKTLKLMKKNVIIINTSRGQLIKTSDLIKYLDKGKIRGAGLDVYEKEKGIFFLDKSNESISDLNLSRLINHRNVILTSHQAFLTKLALKQIAVKTLENINTASEKK